MLRSTAPFPCELVSPGSRILRLGLQESLELPVLIMIAAAFGISEALVQSGAADLIAHALMAMAGSSQVQKHPANHRRMSWSCMGWHWLCCSACFPVSRANE